MSLTIEIVKVSFGYKDLTRKGITVIGFLTMCFLAQGQKQYQNWELSQTISLDFSTNPPGFTRKNTLNQADGGASISDSTGQLLFYGGGTKLYNREHAVMPHGSGLTAGNASTQSMLIVPNPVVDTLYYVFTTEEAGHPAGFMYNIINLTADSGRGDVSKSNIPLFAPCAEKQAAIRKLGDCGYWVIAHELNSSNFRVFQVDEYGVNPANEDEIAIQSIGLGHGDDSDGQMKFSQDGTMLTIINRDSSAVELFDFDLFSGKISNPRFAKLGGYLAGVAFSSSGSSLFVTQRDRLHQFDLSGEVTAESFAINRRVLGTTSWSGGYFKSLHLCPDSLVWVAVSNGVFFGQIINPDGLGNANYVHQSFPVVGSVVKGSMNDFTVGLDWDNSSCNGVHPPRIDSTLYFFTYVTPNGDGFNDVFFIKNIHLYPKSIIRIFNSLGELIFEEEGYSNNWSPSHLDAGTYYYQLEQEGGEVFRDKLTIVN